MAAAGNRYSWACLGVWRSLVARSVRVGEVRSSNLRTPIAAGETPFPPRLFVSLGREEVRDRVSALAWALRDQQVARVGDDA